MVMHIEQNFAPTRYAETPPLLGSNPEFSVSKEFVGAFDLKLLHESDWS